MADISEMLGDLLSDPKTVDKLRALFDEGKMPQPAAALLSNDAPPPSDPPPVQGNDAGALLQMAQGIDPQTAMRLLSAVKAMRSDKEDDRTRLLKGLKPYLSAKRAGRVDEATQMLRLIGALGLFTGDGKGDAE